MKVLFAHSLFQRFEDLIRQRFGDRHQLHFLEPAELEDPAVVFDDADVFVTVRFPAAWVSRFPALRLVHAAGAGLDKIVLEALPPEVRVCCTLGHGRAVAEHVVMVMLALVRNLVAADRELRDGRWLNPAYDPGIPLPGSVAGKSAVVLGTGEIGVATAELLRGLHVRCTGVNRTGQVPAGSPFARVISVAAWHEVLPAADFLIVALPLAPETRGLVGREELALLRSTAYLVNVARGPIVDEAALFEALQHRVLAGAAMDVWYAYPEPGTKSGAPSRLPFGKLDNVIVTPHLSGFTDETFRHRAEEIATNILAFEAGGALRHEIARPNLLARR